MEFCLRYLGHRKALVSGGSRFDLRTFSSESLPIGFPFYKVVLWRLYVESKCCAAIPHSQREDTFHKGICNAVSTG